MRSSTATAVSGKPPTQNNDDRDGIAGDGVAGGGRDVDGGELLLGTAVEL